MDLYKKGLELAQNGQNQQALECITEYLRTTPNDSEALNDAGAIYYCLGDNEKAIEFLEKAWAIDSDSGEICWNLVEAYLASGYPNQAAQLFDDLDRLGLSNCDVINRTAKEFIDKNDKGNATEAILRSLKMADNQEILKPMLQIIKAKRPKVAFFNGCCGGADVKFLEDIMKYVDDRFDIRFFSGTNTSQMEVLLQWADIAWFDWATDMLISASVKPRKCKIITRLHRFEAYTKWIDQIEWENVDTLILVGNSHIRKHLESKVPGIDGRTNIITIPNGVDLEKYAFVNHSKGKNIACIGYLNLNKNPMYLLQCMQKLHYIDNEYRLFFAGNFQNEFLEQYMRHTIKRLGLSNVVYFDGWQKNIPEWLSNKHYIVSTSIGESQGMGMLEGMACGLKPVIHHFPGADETFGRKYLFDIAEQFCEQILSDDYNPAEYREFVEQRYPQQKQLKDINNLLVKFEKDIDISCQAHSASAVAATGQPNWQGNSQASVNQPISVGVGNSSPSKAVEFSCKSINSGAM